MSRFVASIESYCDDSVLQRFFEFFFAALQPPLYPAFVPRKQPMPPEEQAVCARLLKFRRSKGLSRAAFARYVGMEAQLLASYELARSQLNYPAAFRILSRFPELNPAWLAGEEDFMEVDTPVTYPAPEELEFGPRTPFTWVFEGELRRRVRAAKGYVILDPKAPEPFFRLTADGAGRLRAEQVMRSLLRRWLAYLPDSKLNQFLDALKREAGNLLESFLKSAGCSEESRYIEAMKRIAEVERLQLAFESALVTPGSKKKDLPDTETSPISGGVKAQLPGLLDRLKKATQAPGKKTELAKFLSKQSGETVPLASVSRWLSGEREPGGEVALQLDAWATAQGFPRAS